MTESRGARGADNPPPRPDRRSPRPVAGAGGRSDLGAGQRRTGGASHADDALSPPLHRVEKFCTPTNVVKCGNLETATGAVRG